MKIRPLIKILTSGNLYSSILVTVAILSGILTLTGCNNKSENPPVSNAQTTAEKDVAMSAKPADTKQKPIAVGEEAKTSNSPVIISTTASTVSATDTVVPASVDSSADTTAEGVADNSGMDKISENDQVIDDSPATPDAPKAQEEKAEISNQPTGHKKN